MSKLKPDLIPVQVISVHDEAIDVRLVHLGVLNGGVLPAFEPGAHIDLHLGPELVRQYSLCGPLADTQTYAVAVKREPQSRGGSRTVHDELKVGSRLTISVPRNNFSVAQDAQHSVLIAGGIGITPLISMARDLHARGRSFEFHYFCRSADHAAFLDELESGAFAPHVKLHFGLETAAIERRLAATLETRPSGGHVYLCGPGPFMDAVKKATSVAWPEEAVHLEYFAAEPRVAAGRDSAFQIVLVQRGITVAVEAGTTIVDALRSHGVEIETSCEQGVCGTCVTDVLEGRPDHRDLFLTAKEKSANRCMALCVSRALTPVLVLDL